MHILIYSYTHILIYSYIINGKYIQTPILCVGELKEEFELGVCVETCTVQLAKSLAGVPVEDARRIVIAYEPVWAIGTGLTATPEVKS